MLLHSLKSFLDNRKPRISKTSLFDLFKNAMSKPTFRSSAPRISKHQKPKRGQKHMSKRMPSGYHSSIVLPTQHQRVVMGRAKRAGMTVEAYENWCRLGEEMNWGRG